MTGLAQAAPSVFLVDVDETLIDEQRIQRDLRDHLEEHCGSPCRERYLAILERLRKSLGYCDYLGALQRYRIEYPQDASVLSVPSFLLDYPFAERLYPHALEVLERLQTLGQAVVLSEGDAVFQPRKIERSGIRDAVDGCVLIYVHKEDAVSDILEQYPARRYVLVDDNFAILRTYRQAWGGRLTTVLVHSGDSPGGDAEVGSLATPDVTVEHVGELLDYDFGPLLANNEIQVVR
jgi:FMN phosphatase YigB (HAD superfamily)